MNKQSHTPGPVTVYETGGVSFEIEARKYTKSPSFNPRLNRGPRHVKDYSATAPGTLFWVVCASLEEAQTKCAQWAAIAKVEG
jgi:hypothetical protein